jgi:hypothetical protein
VTKVATGLPGFEPENDLESAMLAAARQPERFAEFLALLHQADVYIPGRDPVGEEGPIAPETVTLPVVEWEGRDAVPVFSSLSRLRQAVDSVPSYMAFHFSDLAALWQEQWMLLNPGVALGLPLSPAQVRGDVDAGTPVGVARTAPYVGEPAVENQPLIAAVVAACERIPAVLEAHRAQIFGADPGERPRLAVGLVISPGIDSELAVGHVRDSISGVAADPVDIIVIDAADPGPVGGHMLRAGRPFFHR